LENQFKKYYDLTKPGIIYGNLLPTVAAFIFASHSPGNTGWHFSPLLFLATIVGMSFVIGSACVFNNYFDREIDAKMVRTKERAIAAGKISAMSALVFASALGLIGFALLYFFVNPLSTLVALVGFVVYVCMYTPLKPRSPYALFVGAVAGAVPPIVGYTAVTNSLDWIALCLFLFLFIWQIPHFLAIATYRYDEYREANIPLFMKTSPTDRQKKIARKIFIYSLLVLLVFSVGLTISPFF
jgi:protoheme IX farnesyltransferase